MRTMVRAGLALLTLLVSCLCAGEPDTVQRARELNRAGKPEMAEQLLRDAISREDHAAEARAELGALLVARKRFGEAVEQFGLAAQQSPKNSDYAVGLAGALIADKRYSVAIEFLRAVKADFDGVAAYHHQLGLAYWALHNFPTALGEFQSALKLDPKLDVALFFIGNCQAVLGDLPAAAASYRAAIRQNPGAVSYHLSLGKVLDQTGPEHSAEAVRSLREALRLSPDDVPSKFALALAVEKNGNVREATRLLEQVTARFPDELAPHIALVRLYTKLSDPAQRDRESAAVRRIQQAQRQRPTERTP
ncbi:MAG: tetratricopeptide repeat protein [Bryobacteraceae bacterium]